MNAVTREVARQAIDLIVDVSKPMSLVERASNALSKAETEAEIKALVEQSKPIVAVTDSASREVCHGSLMTLKNMRILIEKRAKAGRDEAVKYQKAIIKIEDELVALIAPEETRLAVIRDEWDSIKAREKEAAIQAEIRRVADLQERIAELRGCQTLSPASGSALILEHIADLEAIAVDESFEEFEQQAADAKVAAIVRLNSIHAAAVAYEAEQAKAIADRAELAKLRAEQADRDRLAKEAQAKADADAQAERDRQEAIAKTERDAEAARQVEANRLERARIAKEEADAKAIRASETKRLDAERAEFARVASLAKAELDRQAEEQRATNAAEEQRLADQRRALVAEQEALRKAQAPIEIFENKVTGETTTVAELIIESSAVIAPVDTRDQLLERLLIDARYYVHIFEPRTDHEGSEQERLLLAIDEALPLPAASPVCAAPNCCLPADHEGPCDDIPW